MIFFFAKIIKYIKMNETKNQYDNKNKLNENDINKSGIINSNHSNLICIGSTNATSNNNSVNYSSINKSKLYSMWNNVKYGIFY